MYKYFKRVMLLNTIFHIALITIIVITYYQLTT